jgi:DNA-binding NarL/FixJ family response regulator
MSKQAQTDCKISDARAFPMNKATWRAVQTKLALSPQQTRIVELILQGRQDKHIAEALNLTVPTVRTYLTRIFVRTDTPDRLALVLHVFALAQGETG